MVLSLLTVTITCGEGSHRINVIVIGLDSLRPDHLSCYGYERNTSPNIDRLAREGVLFENALSQAPWTTASFATILTSLYPTQHGANGLSNHLRATVPTLATLLKASGYATGAIVNAPALKPEYGVNRGFDHYDVAADQIRTADQTTAAAIRWIDLNKDRAFFMFVHYFDTHIPYSPPRPYDTIFDPQYEGPLTNSVDLDIFSSKSVRLFQHLDLLTSADWNHIRALYDGEIMFVDAVLGDLFRALEERGLRDKTIVVLLADHGDEHYEHGGFEHGHSLYNEIIRVPLIISLPNTIPKGLRLTQQVRLIDVTPTILDLVGVTSTTHFEGVSLKPVILGTGKLKPSANALLPPDIAYAEATTHGAEKKAVTAGGWKLIYDALTENMQVFNLADDPTESRNLAHLETGQQARLEQILFRTLLGISDSWYIEVAGGDKARLFDLRITTEKGGLVGSIHPYRFLDSSGQIIEMDSLVNKQGHVMQVRGLQAQTPVTLAFKFESDNIPLEFDFRIDGRPATEQTFLGEALEHPETMPFTQMPKRAKSKSKGIPSRRPSPPYLIVWHTENPYAGNTAMRLDDQTKKELRALGYIQ